MHWDLPNDKLESGTHNGIYNISYPMCWKKTPFSATGLNLDFYDYNNSIIIININRKPHSIKFCAENGNATESSKGSNK